MTKQSNSSRPVGSYKSSIVDQHGREVTRYLYPSPSVNPKAYKPRVWISGSTKKDISAADRGEMVNYSRKLFAQVDVLSAAVNSKNNWSFGDAWSAQYTGSNQKWGEEAENFLNNQWMPNCNVRGPNFGFKRSLLLSGISWDVDGDDVMVLTKSENGFPMVAFFPGTSVASSSAFGYFTGQDEKVKEGPFKGSTIFDGVILDKNSRPIGFRIYGQDGEFKDVSSFDADMSFEPQWHDQVRGFPRIATSLLKWMDLQDIDEFIQRGVKRAASVGLITKNEQGEAPIGNEIITTNEVLDPMSSEPPAKAVAYEEISGGEMYYLSAPGNETIEALDFKNPHPNTEAFIERITRGCLASVGWYSELLDLSQTGRAPARLLVDLANQSIWSRQRTGERRWRRAVSYAIAVAMKNGFLSKNSDGFDPYKWEPGLPKPLSVDAGNEAQADREALKLGLTSRSIVSQKMHGIHYRALDKQRVQELKETINHAIGISNEFPQIPIDKALELLEQRSPNPMQQQQQSNSKPTQ